MNDAIVSENLVKKYRGVNALNQFSLSVPAYSIMGLVGRNGAGKTTWMMSIAGFVRPQKGTINLLGLGPFHASRHSGRIGILPQDSELPLDGRIRDLLMRYAYLQGLRGRDASRSVDSLIDAFNLRDKAHEQIKSLSHGMRKRVMVAQAFIGSPDVVLLDEPLSGLDPVEADRMRNFIRECRGHQTIVISSHQLEDIEKLCTHVAFVANGKVERVETLAKLTALDGRVAYRLRDKPTDFNALATILGGATFAWDDESRTLTVSCDKSLSPEEINTKLLPMLIPFGIISILSGRTLEEAYLENT